MINYFLTLLKFINYLVVYQENNKKKIFILFSGGIALPYELKMHLINQQLFHQTNGYCCFLDTYSETTCSGL